jgi:uncharacterized Fe-S cluster-containing protein
MRCLVTVAIFGSLHLHRSDDILTKDITVCIAVATQRSRGNNCLVTAGKYVDNIRATARQLLGKQVPAATNTNSAIEVLLDCNNENEVFCGPC